MDAIRQDVRYALRSLLKTPGFAAVAVLLLALTVGLSVTIFSVVNAVYFSTVPYRDPGRLAIIEQVKTRPACTRGCSRMITAGEFSEWVARLHGMQAVAGLSEYSAILAGPTVREAVTGSVVSANFFTVLGLHPILGRAFTSDDDLPGADDVAILSHPLWLTRFGGDSSIVGRSITLDTRRYRVIGIMPVSAPVGRPIFYAEAMTSAFFIPMGPLAARMHLEPRFKHVVARLAPAVSLERLRTGLDVLLADVERQSIETPPTVDQRATWRTSVTPLRVKQAHAFASSYSIFLGAVLFVALIACANLAGLFLARLSGRRREVAVRAALGASRRRLVRQFMTEGMLVAGVGGALGILLAQWGTDLARIVLPAKGIPYWTSFSIDARVTAFAMALTAAGGLIFGLGPALMLARRGADLSLREVSGTLTGGRTVTVVRRALVSVEIACTLVLLTGAGLLGKTFFDAATRDIGVAKQNIIRGALSRDAAEARTSAERRAVAKAVLARLRVIPGVDGAALNAGAPAGEPRHPGMTRTGDQAMIAAGVAPATADGVTPDYFRVHGIAILEGRVFTTADGPGTPRVAILSEPTARHLFPHETAVGRRIKFGPPSSTSPWMTIVGVVRGTRGFILPSTEPYHPEMYRPLAQAPTAGFDFAVHTRGSDADLLPAVRNAVHEVAPSMTLVALTTIENILNSRWLAPLRANTVVLGALAIVAVMIAGLGLYGVIAYLVTERTREIGIRMALGATQPAVVRLMVRSAVTMIVWGVAGGLLGSFALTRLLRAFLYGTSPTDPRVFMAATIVLTIAALAAAYAPARRATRVDPVRALRSL